MGKYKINIDPQLPSEEETKSFQNFDNILKEYEEVHKPFSFFRNVFKNFKLVKILILIHIVLLALYFSHRHKKTEAENSEKIDTIDQKPTSFQHLQNQQAP